MSEAKVYETQMEADGNSIFRLLSMSYWDFHNSFYPEFKICIEELGYFSSLQRAEDRIKGYAREGRELFGFIVDEKPIDPKPRKENSLSTRTYLGDGTLFCTEEDQANSGGRYQLFTSNQFQVGDFVEVCRRYDCGKEKLKVRLAVISEVRKFPGTLSNHNRSYVVLYGESERPKGFLLDPENYQIFPPRLPIPEILKTALRLNLKDSIEESRQYLE